jgi:predicted unusual protein kinase regulating ubiquinone biosynthesis (AarF/ABC1/UbiB family)
MNPRAYWRFVVVAYQFLPLLWAYARDRRRFLIVGGSRRVSRETQRQRAASLLESLLTLGPTFIKLGQLLSTRPDILPAAYIDELSALQDEVPPAEWDDARRVVQDELGPVDEYFESFDTGAISGASLGQVYRAEAETGPVAVKVRRPDVKGLVEADLRVIRWSLPLLLYFVGDARSFSLETLADEFDKTIRQEMDYEREARMLEEIKANFEGDDDVRIPEVIDSHSTGRLLTMEYVEGTKITDTEELAAEGIDRAELAETLQIAYLQMILDDGVYHADPHPGNLAVQDDGTLVFYDFGMSGRVDPYIQEKILDFYLGVANKNTEAILDALVEMGTLSPQADRQVMGEILELAIADARGDDIEQFRVQQVVGQLEDTIYEFPFRLPSNLALVLRVATVAEGVCVTLDPEFDFIDIATDYLGSEGYLEETARDLLRDRGEEVREAANSALRTPPKLEKTLDRATSGNLRVKAAIRDDRDHFEGLARRLVYGMVLASSLLATALLYSTADYVPAAVAGTVGAFCAVVLLYSFRRNRGFNARPQFTRQNMRKRQDGEE